LEFAHFSHVWNKPDLSPSARYAQLWRELALCDELGFEYGFAVEHHFSPHESWMPSPAVYTTGAALHTRRMRIGPMGYIVPLYDPLRIVEEAAVLDQLSNGRLELGLVSGISPGYFGPYRADFANRRALADEAIQLIKSAFSQPDGLFSFRGEHHQYTDVRLSLLPVQRPHPPMWLPSRDPSTLAFLAQEGIDTGSLLFVPREEGAPRYREYVRAWIAAGHPRPPRISYWAPVYIDETDALAVERATPHIQYVFGAMGGFGDVGGVTIAALAENFRKRGELGAAEIADHLLDMDYLLRRNLVFVGSAATVAARLKMAASEGAFNVFAGEFNLGGMAEEQVMRSIRLFGEQVRPALRDFDPLRD
jgi:alkanesulfonate monooxygenase SsuD/methylene tetrahydromethanopterin reductase-like flavin-dependent oxidoreductase (luciferase family)